jgi:molybdenum cofactor biosynthesis enzyme MoaA
LFTWYSEGGEPLLRKGIEDLVRMLRSINNLNRVDMTTNGWFLAEKAKDLQKAGLQGVTVSLLCAIEIYLWEKLIEFAL